MFRKNHFLHILFLIALSAGSTAIFGQGATIGGKVQKQNADETTVPVANARVDCYRVDIKQGCRSVETNDKGEFIILGIPYSAQVVIAVSGSGIGPRISQAIKPGTTNVVITVIEGDSSVLTEEEVREVAAATQGSTGELTAEQKKAQAEYEKKLAETIEKNKKIEEKTAIIRAALTAGNNAFNSGNYDLAIAKYEEGISADPEFIGSAPVLLNNKGVALKKRAVTYYNAAIKSTPGKGDEIRQNALVDLTAALSSFDKALTILTKANAAEIVNQVDHKKNIFNALDGGRDVISISAQIQVADPEMVGPSKTITTGYIEAESDKAKKGQAQTNLAKFLMFAYDYEGAAAEFKKALEYSPQDPDILANLGLSLFTAAAISNNKAQKQESLNYLDVYLKVAPKDHSMRDGVAETVKDLTTVDKLKPQKL